MEKLKFGFWPVKGAGEAIRLLMHYLGQEYEHVIPENKEKWMTQDVPNLLSKGLDFPNLPYIQDGDFYLSQSEAIPLYIAEKNERTDLFGKTPQDRATHRQLEGVLAEIRKDIVTKILKPNYKDLLTESTNEGSRAYKKIKLLSRFLGEKEFFFGYVTFFDIYATYIMHASDIVLRSAGVEGAGFFACDNLKGLHDRVLKLPGIKEYVESPAWKRPLMPPTAAPWLKFE